MVKHDVYISSSVKCRINILASGPTIMATIPTIPCYFTKLSPFVVLIEKPLAAENTHRGL